MTIKEEVQNTFAGTEIGTLFTRAEIIEKVHNKYGRNAESIIPTDYCYNRINNGLCLENHFAIFEYTFDKQFKYLGVDYLYTGAIFHKPKGKNEICVGKMKDGILEIDNLVCDEVSKENLCTGMAHKTTRNVSLQ